MMRPKRSLLLLPLLLALPACNEESPGPARIQVSPAAIEFGSVIVGENARALLTITNPGGSALEILSVSLTGSATASFAAEPTGPEIVAGGSRAINVAFHPTRIGDHRASLTIGSNAEGQAAVSVALSGLAVARPDAGVELDATSTSSDAASGDRGGLDATSTSTDAGVGD